jgi:hypothetical protein
MDPYIYVAYGSLCSSRAYLGSAYASMLSCCIKTIISTCGSAHSTVNMEPCVLPKDLCVLHMDICMLVMDLCLLHMDSWMLFMDLCVLHVGICMLFMDLCVLQIDI